MRIQRAALIVLAGVACAGVFLAAAADPFRNVARAKGFKWAPAYYSATNGVQRPKTLVTGSEGRFLSNNVVVYIAEPRIESYKEDGSPEWVVTAVDCMLNTLTRTATSTNVVAYQTSDTNVYITGRGFMWQQTNRLLILSNQTYTWLDRSATNAPSLR